MPSIYELLPTFNYFLMQNILISSFWALFYVLHKYNWFRELPGLLVNSSLCGLVAGVLKFRVESVRLHNSQYFVPLVKVGALCPVQQPGPYWDRSSAFSFVEVGPTQRL